jgi:DNA-directed RNA polymerase beta subunit
MDESDPMGYMIIKGQGRIFIGTEGQRSNSPIYKCYKDLMSVDVISANSPSRLQMDMHRDGTISILMKKHMDSSIPLIDMVYLLGGTRDTMIAAICKPTDDENVQMKTRAATQQIQEYRFAEFITYFNHRVRTTDYVLDVYLLPHLGTKKTDRMQKLYWILQYARGLIECTMKMRPLTDRDHLAEKRVKLAGEMMEILVRTALNVFQKSLATILEKQLAKNNKMNLLLAMRHASHGFSSMIHRALATGVWPGGKMKIVGVTRPLELSRSHVMGISTIRAIHQPLPVKLKNAGPRQIHGSHWGFICPSETPDNENIGFYKNPALLCDVTCRGDDVFWMNRIHQVVTSKLTLPCVMLNGTLIPRSALCHANPQDG